MAKAKTSADLSREEYLVRELRDIAGLIKEARARGYATLLTKQLARQDDLQGELVDLREKAKAPDRTSADHTPEEWAARIAEDAGACSDDDLDVYMQTWAARRGYLVTVEAGEVRLVRRRAATA